MAYILKIDGQAWSGRGPIVTRHDSEQAAKAELVDYVCRNWDCDETPLPPPEDEDEMITEYFEGSNESYTITEVK